MRTLLKAQEQLIKSSSDITIVNWNRLEGASSGMVFKWLYSGQSALMLDDRHYQNFKLCCDILTKEKIDFEVTKTSVDEIKIQAVAMSPSITFVNKSSKFEEQIIFYGANHSLLLVDNVDMYFKYENVVNIINRLKPHQQIVFSCEKGNLGWRHLEYYRGEVVIDPETGNLVEREYSWDSCLIDWNHKDLKRHYSTRADEGFYDKRVNIIN